MRSALRSADSVDNPRRAKLMNLYEDIMLDAHLTSQIELRHQTVLSTPFDIKVNQEVDDEATAALNAASWVTALNTHILNSAMYGHTLVELTTTDSGTEPVAVTLLPRQNVIPEKGLLLLRRGRRKGHQVPGSPRVRHLAPGVRQRTRLRAAEQGCAACAVHAFCASCWSDSARYTASRPGL